MKLTLLLPPRPDASWALATQLGVRYAVTKASPILSGRADPSDRDALAALHREFKAHGLTLLGLEGDQFEMSRIKLGQPGREEDLDRYQRMLANMGELGLGLLCYNFMARTPGQAHDWSRTRQDFPLRGGALTSEFRLDAVPHHDARPSPTSDELWTNYAAFLRAVIPSAEAAGVRMALHPDDPPISRLAGVGRIFHEADAFDRAYELSHSRANAITFCQANFKLMPGDVVGHAQRLASRIAFVHWRDVCGRADHFNETFHDDGPTDMAAMIQLYHDLEFAGPIRMDHAPRMHGESEPWMPGYGIQGRLMAAAYLRGLCHAAQIPLA